VFRRMAKSSHGAYCHFNAHSAEHLGELLGAVAVFAAGGQLALNDYTSRHGPGVLRLTKQITRD
ncbi:MAG: hypothetical protein ACRERS_02440, partial [Methylococcales bacterium]